MKKRAYLLILTSTFALFLVALAQDQDQGSTPTRHPCRDNWVGSRQIGTKFWSKDELKIHFMGGTPELHRKVEEYAKIWEEHSLELRFEDWGVPDSDIRITFDPRDGYWSAIGREAKERKFRGKATMNLGFPNYTSDGEIRRLVLHEFGHALGLLHEHMMAEKPFEWDVEAVKTFYREAYGWTEREIENNVLKRYSRSHRSIFNLGGIRQAPFDQESIMLYPVLQEHTVGNFSVGWNDDLSSRDKEFIRKHYQ